MFRGIKNEGDFLFLLGFESHLGVKFIVVCVLVECNVRNISMAKKHHRSLSDRLQELMEAIKEALSPRQPAPIPIPAREREVIIRRR